MQLGHPQRTTTDPSTTLFRSFSEEPQARQRRLLLIAITSLGFARMLGLFNQLAAAHAYRVCQPFRIRRHR
jgi:hypothetical protein